MDDRVQGSLFGLAYGDAMGLPTEFAPFQVIVARHGVTGPQELPEPARVTDDTQMTLAVGGALLAALREGPLTAARLEPHLRERYLGWLVDPENVRAPGRTCIEACRRMARGATWLAATEPGSKGCGANMRVAPIGLVEGIGDDVACLAGAFVGAHLGMAAWPPEWAGRIEYSAQLEWQATGLCR